MMFENNPNWRGGWEDYYGPDWESQRRLALKRDNKTCNKCEMMGNTIHHIVPYRVSHDNSLENLLTLCPNCHSKIENNKEG